MRRRQFAAGLGRAAVWPLAGFPVMGRAIQFPSCAHTGSRPDPPSPLGLDRTAFQTSPQHSGTTRESSETLAWRRMTERGTLSSWSNWTAGDVNGLFLARRFELELPVQEPS